MFVTEFPWVQLLQIFVFKFEHNSITFKQSFSNWNQYYNLCVSERENPITRDFIVFMKVAQEMEVKDISDGVELTSEEAEETIEENIHEEEIGEDLIEETPRQPGRQIIVDVVKHSCWKDNSRRFKMN